MAEEGDGESKPHIIIDNGTGYCKAGLSGEEALIMVLVTVKLV